MAIYPKISIGPIENRKDNDKDNDKNLNKKSIT